MSKTITTTVQATLDVVFIKGRYGLFPVGTIKSNIGNFTCRDQWLETFEQGSYEGEFDIDEISLYGYMTRGSVREQRTMMRATVRAYRIEEMSEELEPFIEHEMPSDPLEEESKPVAISVEKVTEAEREDELPDWLKDEQPSPKLFNDNDEISETVLFIRDKLRSVGSDSEWNLGDDITVPPEIDRLDQRSIVKTLKASGYRLIDPNQRLWSMTAEVTNA